MLSPRNEDSTLSSSDLRLRYQTQVSSSASEPDAPFFLPKKSSHQHANLLKWPSKHTQGQALTMSYQIPPQVNDVFQVTMDKKSGL